MAQDGDRFEPRLGRSRRDTVRPPTTLRTALMGRVARAGGNPRRLPSALPGPEVVQTIASIARREFASRREERRHG